MTNQDSWDHHTATEDAIRASAGHLPLYAADGWDDPMTALWPLGADGRAETAGLLHGDPDGTGPTLLVVSTLRPPENLAASLRHENPGTPPGPGPATTGQVDVTVDGRLRSFALSHSGEQWQAWAPGIVLIARGGAGVPVLRTVRDIEPHLAARRRWIQRRHG